MIRNGYLISGKFIIPVSSIKFIRESPGGKCYIHVLDYKTDTHIYVNESFSELCEQIARGLI